MLLLFMCSWFHPEVLVKKFVGGMPPYTVGWANTFCQNDNIICTYATYKLKFKDENVGGGWK